LNTPVEEDAASDDGEDNDDDEEVSSCRVCNEAADENRDIIPAETTDAVGVPEEPYGNGCIENGVADEGRDVESNPPAGCTWYG
jgi:hypothetical protein